MFVIIAINYALYHPKWPLITRVIRFKRAEGKYKRCNCQHGKPHRSTGYRVSLATVHLNHDRTNNRFYNLGALCQSCHILWDHNRHLYNRKYGTETYYQNGLLFPLEEMNITIPKLKNFGFTRMRGSKSSHLTISSTGSGTITSVGNKIDSLGVTYRPEDCASGNSEMYRGYSFRR